MPMAVSGNLNQKFIILLNQFNLFKFANIKRVLNANMRQIHARQKTIQRIVLKSTAITPHKRIFSIVNESVCVARTNNAIISARSKPTARVRACPTRSVSTMHRVAVLLCPRSAATISNALPRSVSRSRLHSRPDRRPIATTCKKLCVRWLASCALHHSPTN